MLIRAGIALAALAVCAGAPSAAASATHRSDADAPRWTPYHQKDFTVAAGTACAFEVDAHVVRDREFSKDVAFYSDGTLRTQLFKGPLVIEYTNASNGKHVRVDQSGRAIETYATDGSFQSILVQSGHFGTTIPAGSSLPRGLYRIGGRWSSLSVESDGTRQVALGPRGTGENLCPRLSG